MQDVCRIDSVPALPKVLICTRQTMRHWGRLQWGERVWCCCYVEENSKELVICIMERAGDRVLLGWLGTGLVTVSITPPPPAPAPVTWSLVTCSLITTGTVTPDANISLSPSFHFQTGWTMHRNVECECALESLDRKDGTSTFPIIWKLFRILKFDIIFNSSGIKQVGHIEFDKICKIASIPYIVYLPHATCCSLHWEFYLTSTRKNI